MTAGEKLVWAAAFVNELLATRRFMADHGREREWHEYVPAAAEVAWAVVNATRDGYQATVDGFDDVDDPFGVAHYLGEMLG